jgi:glycosyltransferase involved in cell wall biosynthesis
MKAPRVTFLYSLGFMPYDGWYRRVLLQALALQAEGCTVTVLAWDRACNLKPRENISGIDIIRFQIRGDVSRGPANAPNHFKFNREIYRHLRQHPADVIHAVNVAMLPVGLWIARRAHAKAVADICEPDNFLGFWPARYNRMTRLIDRIEKACSARYDQVFVHNAHQLATFQAAGVNRITQVGSYPDRTLLRPTPRIFTGDRITIGRLGTAYAGNGYEEVVTGFRAFREKRATVADPRDFRLRIAGKVFDGYATAFNQLLAPIRDQVEISGAYDVKDLADLYESIDVSLLLYGKHAFGNVTPTKLFESMACGVPVVVSDTGDMASIVKSADCGVVVDPSNPQSIADGLELTTNDQNRMRTMSANALRAAHDCYTWEAVKTSFLDAYRTVLTSTRKPSEPSR